MVKIPCETERLYIPECGEDSCDLHSKVITENGTYNAEDDNYDGYYQVTVNVEPELQSKTVTQNGIVTPDSGYDGLSQVTVNVPAPPSASGNSF